MNFPAKNLNAFDRILRGIVGAVAMYFGWFGAEWIGEPIVQGILLVFGVANLVSFFISWCVVYAIAGLSTCSKESAQDPT